ncbi:MAG: HAMP domain-containing sensor histidine kinase [Solirubrobacterales bacterium]
MLGATGVFVYLRFASELNKAQGRAESLQDLLELLLLSGPVALILASLAAYWVAAAALHPVEAMRARAATISAAEPDERLPVPPTHDEVARLGATLNEMLERLGEAIEHERTFVADASHELRTPLAILRTELDLALTEGRSAAELRAALASAAEETDRLSQLAEGLLTIAQTERGELPLRLGRIDLREALEEGRRRFARRAEEEGRTISLQGQPVEVRADRLRIEQATANVLDNALRYGSGEVSISLAVTGDETVEVRIGDHGPGFPPDFLSRAFERFSRPSGARSDGGSGRGVPMVRTSPRAHGGEAHAANTDGGAEVWLSLPCSGRKA